MRKGTGVWWWGEQSREKGWRINGVSHLDKEHSGMRVLFLIQPKREAVLAGCLRGFSRSL